MSKRKLREDYRQVVLYFCCELAKHLMASFEECLEDCPNTHLIEEILPHSIMWEDAKPSLIILKVKERDGSEVQHASQN